MRRALSSAIGIKMMDNENKGVVICFGDSITEGMGMPYENNYPSLLRAKLEGQIKVINAGVSGETSNSIMSRANAIDFTLTHDITFKKGQSEVVLNRKLFSTMHGGEICYRYTVFGKDLPIKNLVIDGEPFAMRLEAGEKEDDHRYIISRENLDNELTLKKGVKIHYDYSEFYDKIYCIVLLMGANDGVLGTTTDELIDRYKKIFEKGERFIAIIPHYSTDYTEKFKEAFGEATVNLREYCKEKVWEEYNLEQDDIDKQYISEGVLSPKFVFEGKKGDCHLSQLGYEILADLVYKKGKELKYWN